ncbi:ABC transporter ATP-binding protein [Vallitalea guaymasensis]|uniref:ATP-binding cassette domain-containing protein n=1 Tax=Vallitalea guaymasensis TaxID=1185412 RepID=A0A8J8MB68_9FIRM|nr:ATP-binding cassette domain-containing protein [Vallitalea guaymasensis]QUH29717.1 ATP-binding cassette domain-containing protein [Vallitalea guaymasensis]
MIEVLNLTKTYGSHKALDNISFKINKGEIVGFLGPNGAGKSTTMNIITGFLSSTEGTVKLDDIDILENPIEFKKKIGYLPEIPPLYMDMTVKEYLTFVCKLKKINKDKIKQEINRVTELTKIKHVTERLINNLSKGYKQRVGLSQALIGDPDVLILDEPTVGLDPKQIIEIRTLIKDLSKQRTVILSTHILSEVNVVCDRVLIINKGRILTSDTVENLTRTLSESNRISIRLNVPATNKENIISDIMKIPGVKEVLCLGQFEKNTSDYLIYVKENNDIRLNIFNMCKNSNYPLLILKPIDLTMEDIFLKVTEG